MLHSYSQIYNLGHAAITDLLKAPVIVEEKIDGSQVSFGVDANGELHIRSKGAPIFTAAPEGMFRAAVESITTRKELLRPGVTIRGEYLAKPKHNCLAYDRIPKDHIIVFDVELSEQNYASPLVKKGEAERLGYECVPVLFDGEISGIDQFRKLLDSQSILGGQKIEGVVIKPAGYNLFGRDKKVLMGKFVSEGFREVHSKTWDRDHRPDSGKDILQILGNAYNTQARWNKAILHLRERGLLQDAPQDIGLLIKEIPEDIQKECEQEIKDQLYHWAWPQLKRLLTRGFPEFYKDQLLKNQFTP